MLVVELNLCLFAAAEGPPKGKVTVFYDVLRSIDNDQWLEFARGEKFLKLSQSDVDNIQHNYKNNVEEQKFQMLLTWGHSFIGKKLFHYLEIRVNCVDFSLNGR